MMPNAIANDMATTIHQLEEQLQTELDNSHCLEIELAEVKRLLTLAINDLRFESQCHNCKYQETGLENICRGCRGNKWEWRFADKSKNIKEVT